MDGEGKRHWGLGPWATRPPRRAHGSAPIEVHTRQRGPMFTFLQLLLRAWMLWRE